MVLSDRIIYAVSGSDSNSETGGLGDNISKSTLREIGQDTKEEGSKSEGKSGGRGSGAPLTSPGDSGPSRELGARPKVGHEGGKGKHRKKKDVVCRNLTRKSARALKGRGQLLASNEGKDGDKKEGKVSSSGLRVVRCDGPRSSHHTRGRRKADSTLSLRGELRGYSCPELLCILFSLAIAVGTPIVLVILSLGNTVKSLITGQENTSADESPKTDYGPIIASVTFLLIAIMFVALVIHGSRSSLEKNKKRKR
ncbi:hypothetical protein [Candidatus Ichthyocystis sparus]|uniref:hypothetical protein n=1 Tax=Candidatus Ichthyocystis sparus TaxID=1561004 RepID=UPI000B869D0B|nr:hypothetical protein [Candidatus Ichthyocystis sparus]